MKKSWMLILVGALLAAGGLTMSARAQSNGVYAVEYNQSTNRFGTIDLWTGNFTLIIATPRPRSNNVMGSGICVAIHAGFPKPEAKRDLFPLESNL